MTQAFQIAAGPIYQKHKPERNERYKRFVRGFPCIVCGRIRWMEAAHFGPHSSDEKASDLDVLPLCHRDHQSNSDSYHKLGPVKFALVHGLDVPALIQMFQQFWQQHQSREALKRPGKENGYGSR